MGIMVQNKVALFYGSRYTIVCRTPYQGLTCMWHLADISAWYCLLYAEYPLSLHFCMNCKHSVGIAGGGGLNPPVHFFNPPSLIYSFVLGGQKITPRLHLYTLFVPS